MLGSAEPTLVYQGVIAYGRACFPYSEQILHLYLPLLSFGNTVKQIIYHWIHSVKATILPVDAMMNNYFPNPITQALQRLDSQHV